jgi:hypothetical protein
MSQIFLSLSCSIKYLVTVTIKVIETENWYQRSRIFAVTKPYHVVLKPFELVSGGIWKSWEKQARESLEFHKQNSMGNCGGSSEDLNANRNLDNQGQAHEIGDKNKDSIKNLTRGHVCYILAKNLSTFCPCPENLRLTLKSSPELAFPFSASWLLQLKPLCSAMPSPP